MTTPNIDNFIQEATESFEESSGTAREIWSVMIDLAQAVQKDIRNEEAL